MGSGEDALNLTLLPSPRTEEQQLQKPFTHSIVATSTKKKNQDDNSSVIARTRTPTIPCIIPVSISFSIFFSIRFSIIGIMKGDTKSLDYNPIHPCMSDCSGFQPFAGEGCTPFGGLHRMRII